MFVLPIPFLLPESIKNIVQKGMKGHELVNLVLHEGEYCK